MGVQEVGLRLVLSGKAQMLAGMREVTAAVKATNAEMAAGSTAAKAGSDAGAIAAAAQAKQLETVGKVGKAAFWGLAAAVTGAAYEGLKVHAAFQTAMTQVTTLAGVSQSRMASLTAGIKALSPQVNQGLVPMADALYRIASTPAGLKATNAQLLQMTKYAGMLATIGGPGTNLEQTARIMGGAMSSGVKGPGSPKGIVSLAAATVGSGDIRMSDFVDFLGTGVLTSGKLTGVPIQQLAAYLALAGSNLQSGQVAGHGLAHGLQLMAAPTAVAGKAMQSIGLAPTELGNMMQAGNLPGAVQRLYGALSGPLGAGSDTATLAKYGISAADIARASQVGFGAMGNSGKTDMNMVLTRMFGGAKMGIPLDMLVTESKNYNSTLAHITSQGSNFGKAWGTQTDTLAFKTGAFEKSIASLADTIGSGLTPAAKGFLTVGTGLVNFLARNREAAIGLATAVTAILGPAIVVYLVSKFRDASGAVSSVVKWYARLLTGQRTVTTSMEVEAATIDTKVLPAVRADTLATGELAAADRSAAMTGGLTGAGGLTMGGRLARGGLMVGGGLIAGGMIQGSNGTSVIPGRSVSANLHTALGQMAKGAGVGAAAGAFVPVLGELGISEAGGAAIGAIGGLAYSERHQIVSAAKHGWDDIFGGGSGSASASAPLQVQNTVIVNLDGKQLKDAIVKQVRSQAARQ